MERPSLSAFKGTGPATVYNYGTIKGDVRLSADQPNAAFLYTGAKITGNLDLGTNSGSTLLPPRVTLRPSARSEACDDIT